jgi:SAM-dependent methyltransferase
MSEDKRRLALTYYNKTGPIGEVVTEMQSRDPLVSIGIVGLGTGTMAAYANPGENMTYYELDEAVERMARNQHLFRYLSDAEERGAKLQVVLGDARLRLNEAKNGEYDLLAIDAFSSDAIPVHLLTDEALKMYLRTIKPDGVIAFHITNRYIDLEPVLGNLAEANGLVTLVRNDTEENDDKSVSDWMLVARSARSWGTLTDSKDWHPGRVDHKLGTWTDDFSNIYSVIDWSRAGDNGSDDDETEASAEED